MTLLKNINNQPIKLMKWMPVFQLMGRGYIKHQISSMLGITYSHICHLSNLFIESGLITETKRGRIVKPELTPKGQELYDLVSPLCDFKIEE